MLFSKFSGVFSSFLFSSKVSFFFPFFSFPNSFSQSRISTITLSHVLLSSSLTSGAPGDTVARNFVPVSVWKQCRSKVEARSRTAPPPTEEAAEVEVGAATEPFSPPPPLLLLPLPTGETCAEMAWSECHIEAARRVSLRSSEASVGTNSWCLCFFSERGRG